MTNPFAPLVLDPAAANRAGRALREVPEAERPRERLAQRGPGGLSAAELIALVWGTGARGNERSGPRRGSARPPRWPHGPGPGVGYRAGGHPRDRPGTRRAAQRCVRARPTGRWTIRAPRAVAERLILQMGRLEREELRVVLLNTKNVVLRVATVYQGNVSSSPRPSG